MSFYSHPEIIRYFYRIKRLDKKARVMALDVGRKYIGCAISCTEIKEAIPYKTYEIDPQYNQSNYDFGAHTDFYQMLMEDMRRRKIKSLVVGYPLDENKNITPMCTFIENFCDHLLKEKIFPFPLTLIDEHRTTKEAALKMLKQNQSSPSRIAAGGMNEKAQPFGSYFKTQLLYQKSVFDVLAAQTILERFLGMYNKEIESYKTIRNQELA
ncbi:unnamed protein product [Moneuplotes crassus]|uniref:YqgF/RNase H-like domain-containing protein n=1 Tax=Euplotes crassus TaxID=5936 RepID=A0AAD1XPF3_EUPCR|nr:unnamed protein product [Moneuplotes crassus]